MKLKKKKNSTSLHPTEGIYLVTDFTKSGVSRKLGYKSPGCL